MYRPVSAGYRCLFVIDNADWCPTPGIGCPLLGVTHPATRPSRPNTVTGDRSRMETRPQVAGEGETRRAAQQTTRLRYNRRPACALLHVQGLSLPARLLLIRKMERLVWGGGENVDLSSLEPKCPRLVILDTNTVTGDRTRIYTGPLPTTPP